MATAGERYERRTGNIWSYAHRGDMSGLRAALARGVSPDMINTVGWTPSHAAAAGGHAKALRLLAKSGADIEIADRGGNFPAHQAAKNGHAHALRVLKESGADITTVRLSHAKGKDVREALIEAYGKAGMTNGVEEETMDAPVGYARKQAKSTAFWGPRRTPISTKIKKKIIKDKRRKRKENKTETTSLDETKPFEGHIICDRVIAKDISKVEELEEPSYVETVRAIKRERKQRQRQKQCRKRNVEENGNEYEKDNCDGSIVNEDSTDSEGDDHKNAYSGVSGVNGFAALSIFDESDEDS